MPRSNDHLRQAEHNQDLLRSLDLETFPFRDWVATIAFYAALHYVQAWFAAQGRGMQFTTHERRNREMNNIAEFRPIVWPSYRTLADQSHLARYQCVWPSKNTVQHVIIPALNDIEKEIRRLLA
jgi:hypothetical protein